MTVAPIGIADRGHRRERLSSMHVRSTAGHPTVAAKRCTTPTAPWRPTDAATHRERFGGRNGRRSAATTTRRHRTAIRSGGGSAIGGQRPDGTAYGVVRA
ncbi:hypothetical protein [Actinocatenispora rupis]|uniref:Uncharacterized protein n=1 Tax=Actinocatenispora rupis TaxID=519421 RepID=A0A8J3JH99_9ACTN|nr:hypothetical protein [Actinocatenispora rupis]GID16377.1 hypothetical protein Aru02nite_72660 [Actinocatenispora rupis]